MWTIKQDLLAEMLNAAKRAYPNEFLCFLGGDTKTQQIKEFVFIPSESDERSAAVDANIIPFDSTIVGSIHSHPNSTNRPSTQDKVMFSKYPINIILGDPFSVSNACAYDQKGNKMQIKII